LRGGQFFQTTGDKLEDCAFRQKGRRAAWRGLGRRRIPVRGGYVLQETGDKFEECVL
jgi:hypothetical protein